MAKPDEWMPLHIGKYLADTVHLSRDEHGAYLLLLMAYWSNGGPILADDKRLAAIAKATPAEWRKLKPALVEFFREDGGRWHQKRADAELAKAKAYQEAKARAGQKGAESRWQKHAPAMAEVLPEQSQTDAPLPSTLTKEEPTSSLRSLVGRATRWPPHKVVSWEWLADADIARHEHGLPPIDLKLEATKFVNYWASKAGGSATKTDWHKTWINWALKAEKPRINGHGRPESSHEQLERVTKQIIAENHARRSDHGGDQRPILELPSPADE